MSRLRRQNRRLGWSVLALVLAAFIGSILIVACGGGGGGGGTPVQPSGVWDAHMWDGFVWG